ncbi:MAG: hypothetical protein RBS80_22820 [Thermoguttaceae bacterium]|jgi:hypothetical protein|nr:hypothetical protein [Thermoguttaceae bacterium]
MRAWQGFSVVVVCLQVALSFGNEPGAPEVEPEPARASVDLGNGFMDHGVATPVSNHRGTVATADGEGRNVVLVWLYDHTGGYALLVIDAATGDTRQLPMPFPPRSDGPFASILSGKNRFYTHFASHFVEYDPAAGKFTFFHRTAPQMAMAMTEDDNGVIWSATYPRAGVVSYNPETGEFRDYGHVYQQNWAQYPRSIATDDAGWVYLGIGSTSSQIIALNPQTGEATPILAEDERVQAYPTVYRDLNGKVYATAGPNMDDSWLELHEGNATKIGALKQRRAKSYIAGSQGLFHRSFPDGKILRACDLTTRTLAVQDPKTGQTAELAFDYTSNGAHLMGLATAPNGTIAGGTAFPMHFFNYNPEQDRWTNQPCMGQWNTVAAGNERFYVGMYTSGGLLEWDPRRPWVPTRADNPDSNPRLIHASSHPTLMRPTSLLIHPDGKTLVLGGTPGYGRTGGGMLLFDLPTQTPTLLSHDQLLPHHSVHSMAALDGGKLLVGSTVSPGTGGERRAEEAELYIFDVAARKIEWHAPVVRGVSGFNAMCKGPGNLMFVFADRSQLLVFDTARREVVHQQHTAADFGTTNSQQGPRVFVQSPEGDVYILFVRGIASLNQETFAITMLATSPVPIGPGGDYLNGRIYFGSGSRLYSFTVPESAGRDE